MQLSIVFCIITCFFQSTLAIWSIWKFNGIGELLRRKDSNDKEERWEDPTGQTIVTFFGFPSSCERSGIVHTCTLSVVCWWSGGISQSGCGASRWIVGCCVTDHKQHELMEKLTNLESLNDGFYEEIENREAASQSLQRRNDILEEYTETCGISNDRIFQKRIIGGREAEFGQFPWQAYIKILAYQCGGVLISRKYVATAAHCILPAKLTDILVYLGELDNQNTGEVEEYTPAELHRVKKRFIHPNFRYKLTQPDRYDIALLELLTETDYSFHILPICLPSPDMKTIGKEAVVAGWGKTDPLDKQIGTNILRSVAVPILDINECMKWHKSKQIIVELYPEMICAGRKHGKQDACLGDSGGPLILIENGLWTLVGITSAGFGCGEERQPGIYHNVLYSVNWIKTIINE